MPVSRRLAAGCLAFGAIALLGAVIAACGKGERGPHLLLISVDTLRTDHLGSYGAPDGMTPHLDALAAESLVFERAFAPTSHTLPSVAAMLTAREPEEVGMLSNRSVLSDEVPTLATLLSRRGHRTGAVVGNYMLRRAAGLDRGFDRYDDRFPQLERNRPIPERVARDTTSSALAMLDELLASGDPVLLWVHFQDPHGPYSPPREHADPAAPRPTVAGSPREVPLGETERGVGQIPAYQSLGRSTDPGIYRDAYAGEVRYVDAEIGRLLAGLRERGLWEETVIIVTADHGEGLGEGDYWFAHGEYLTEPLVRVPLLVRVPGEAAGRRESLVGLVDVAPTLLALSGAPPPPRATGRDALAPDLPSEHQIYQNALLGPIVFVPRLALIEGDWQYRLAMEPDGERESLHRIGDPRNRADEEPEHLARLREALRARRKALRFDYLPRERELPPEERALLRSLGYVFED